MRRLVAWLDVDFQQWKVLTAVLLTLDFRGTAMRSASGVSGAAATLIFQLLFYTLIGAGLTAVVMFARQLYLAGTVIVGMTMFIIGTSVLLDLNSAIASPGDEAILGFRPVSSRTYFAVRLTNVLVYTTVLTTAAPRGSGFSLVTMAVMMFPPMLKFELARSEGFRASWIFFACPIDRMKIVRASKNVLVAYFLIPYLAFVAAITTYFAGHSIHVAVHITLLGLISHLVLQTVMFLDPALPFSRPPVDKGRRSTSFIGLVGSIVIVVGIIGSFSPALYRSVPATLTALALLLLASVALDRVTRARVERQTGSLEFEG